MSDVERTDGVARRALQRIVTASGLRSGDPTVSVVDDGFDARIDGVLQRFRCERVADDPRAVDTSGVEGAAARPWRWSVETRFSPNADHAARLGVEHTGSSVARVLDEHVYAGIASADGDIVRWRAHVMGNDPGELRTATLLAHAARVQRSFALGRAMSASVASAKPKGPRSTAEAALLDTGVEVFAAYGAAATHLLERGIVRVRFPWSVIGPGDGASLDTTYLERSNLGADVVVDVYLPVASDAPAGVLVETRLPIPEDVDVAELDAWRTRMNDAEIDRCAAGPAVGAWCLGEPVPQPRLRAWAHRFRVPVVDGAPAWPMIADLALGRVRWAVQEHGSRYHLHPREERPWAEEPAERARRLVAVVAGLRPSPPNPSRRVPASVPALAVVAHVWACARARRTGPWLAHAIRSDGRTAPRRPVADAAVGEDLEDWMRRSARFDASDGWRWSTAGGARSPVGAPMPYRTRLDDRDVTNLLANAEAADIAVVWRPLRDRGLLGYATRQQTRGGLRSGRSPLHGPRSEAHKPVVLGHFVAAVDASSAWMPYDEVFVHELAHVLLGHVGATVSPTRPNVAPFGRWNLGTAVSEAEACLVVLIVLGRRGVRPEESIARFWVHLDAARRLGDDDLIDLWHVLLAAERLLAWCVDRPDATTAPAAVDRPVPSGGGRRVEPLAGETSVVAGRRTRSVPKRRS